MKSLKYKVVSLSTIIAAAFMLQGACVDTGYVTSVVKMQYAGSSFVGGGTVNNKVTCFAPEPAIYMEYTNGSTNYGKYSECVVTKTGDKQFALSMRGTTNTTGTSAQYFGGFTGMPAANTTADRDINKYVGRAITNQPACTFICIDAP